MITPQEKELIDQALSGLATAERMRAEPFINDKIKADLTAITIAARALASGDVEDTGYADYGEALEGMESALTKIRDEHQLSVASKALAPLVDAWTRAQTEPEFAEALSSAITQGIPVSPRNQPSTAHRNEGAHLPPIEEVGIRPHLDRYLKNKPKGTRGVNE